MSERYSINYVVGMFTPFSEEFACYDALGNLVSQITEMGLKYGDDFAVGGKGIDSDGYQYLQIDFKTEELAMLVKLKGVNPVDSNRR